MPAITTTHYGQGRGKKAQDATLAAETVGFFSDPDTLAAVQRGVYVDLVEGDFTGPKTKVGTALLEALNLNPDEWAAPTKAPVTDDGIIAVTLRPIKSDAEEEEEGEE